MKKNWLAVALLIVLAGCGGGGGGGGSSPAPVNEPLTGTYRLTGFTIIYNNGVSVTEKSPVVTSWSGSLELGPTTGKQVFTLNGIVASSGGPYTATWTTATSGTIDDGGDPVAFTLTNGSLSIHMHGTSGTLSYEEWDYWQKVSPSYTVKSVERAGDPTGGLQPIAPLLEVEGTWSR
jgi:hypothetical protein